MRAKKLIVFGFDPGVTRFGAVAIEDPGSAPVAYATFDSEGDVYSKHPFYHRVTQLAVEVAEWANEVAKGYGSVVVAMETPIYNNNARSFQIQWRLFQQTVSELVRYLSPDSIIEVGPTTVKKNATGNGSAKKIDMVCASHFDGPGFGQDDAEALADAEAVANCWWSKKGSEGEYMPHSDVRAARFGARLEGRFEDG